MRTTSAVRRRKFATAIQRTRPSAPAQHIFNQAYLVDQKNDNPEQFRAIGWCGDRLCSVIFEVRYDAAGEYYHLITAWQATKQEKQSYAENV